MYGSCSIIVYHIRLYTFSLTLLVVLSLLLSIVPAIHLSAYAATKIFHIVLIYLTMDWLREMVNGVLHGKDRKTLSNLKYLCYILLIITIQCLLIDLLSFGGVIIYYDTIATNNLVNKGIIFLVFLYTVQILQILIDGCLLVGFSNSLTILGQCLKDGNKPTQ